MPLRFETNLGQTNSRVRFLARSGSLTVYLTSDEAVMTSVGSSAPIVHLPNPGDRLSSLGSWRRLSMAPPKTLEDATRTDETVIRLKLAGANTNPVVTGADELPGRINYFLGNDSKKWHTNISTYARVRYHNVYPGVDLVYYGNQSGQLENDFVVAASADPNAIILNVEADGLRPAKDERRSPPRIAANGDLIFETAGGEVRFQKPVVYQPEGGPPLSAVGILPESDPWQSSIDNRQYLDGRYALDARQQIRFILGPYDHTRPIVIDPVLSYSTYLGGGCYDVAQGIAVDSDGNAYLTGFTCSSDFPTLNTLQPLSFSYDAFVTKLNSAGTALIYSTFVGGTSSDEAYAIAVDSSGDAYITGVTPSTDFPTVNPIQAGNNAAWPGSNAFVFKLNPTGSALAYSTYLGGSTGDSGKGIAVDTSGNAYVTGSTQSLDFPVTIGAFETIAIKGTCGSTAQPFTCASAFVAKLNSAGSALVYSTYLGGSSQNPAMGIAVDATGNAYVAGWAESSDFPTTPGAFQTKLKGIENAFITKLNDDGSALIYSTYLGGSSLDYADGIAVDAFGNAYVAGETNSSDFPTLSAAQASLKGGPYDAFVTKLNPAGSALVYSTFVGGSGMEWTEGIAVDSSGSVYVTGATASNDFPTVSSVQSSYAGGPSDTTQCCDAFLTKLSPTGSAFVYSTYLGGSNQEWGYGVAADALGNAYLAGHTASTDFPTVNPLQAALSNSQSNVFAAKISTSPTLALSTVNLDFGSQNLGTTSIGQLITLTNTGDDPLAIADITASGDFEQSNTCGTSIEPGDDCSINVTFDPTVSGARSGTLSVADNAPDSPQSVSLSGTGQDFSFTVSSGSTTSATVAPGQSAAYILSVGGESGFDQSVSFACTGVPSRAACAISPNPVKPGTSATYVTVIVTTTAASEGTARIGPSSHPPLPLPGVGVQLILAMFLAALTWFVRCRARLGVSESRSTTVALAGGFLLVLALTVCGGGGSTSKPTHNPGTTPGTYILTVTGTAGTGSTTLSHNVTLTLKVN